MLKKTMALILFVSTLSLFDTATVNAEKNISGTELSDNELVSPESEILTPGIYVTGETPETIEHFDTEFEDVINSFGEKSIVYSCDDSSALIVTEYGKEYFFECQSPFSVVKMRKGTEPPVKEINEKIGAADKYEVVFFTFQDSYEYKFYVDGKEYKDLVYDILENDENVLSIEERKDVKQIHFGIHGLLINSELTVEEIKNKYFPLDSVEVILEENLFKEWDYYFLFKEEINDLYKLLSDFNEDKLQYKLDIIVPDDSGLDYCVYASSSEIIFQKDFETGDINYDGKLDVTDLSELSLALIGDRKLSEIQQKVADVDGDGKVTLSDLARMRQYLSKVITSFG